MKAKAIRTQRKEVERKQNASSLQRFFSNLAAGQKRTHFSIFKSGVFATSRDGRTTEFTKQETFRPLDDIKPARNFTKYVEYNFCKITDTKSGFLTAEDDLHNKQLHASNQEEKSAYMMLKE